MEFIHIKSSKGGIYAITSVETNPRFFFYEGAEIAGTFGRVGIPPFYKVVGFSEGAPVLELLSSGSNEYNYVQKWAGFVPKTYNPVTGEMTRTANRRVLNQPGAGCRISEKDISLLFQDE